MTRKRGKLLSWFKTVEQEAKTTTSLKHVILYFRKTHCCLTRALSSFFFSCHELLAFFKHLLLLSLQQRVEGALLHPPLG